MVSRLANMYIWSVHSDFDMNNLECPLRSYVACWGFLLELSWLIIETHTSKHSHILLSWIEVSRRRNPIAHSLKGD